MPPPIWLVFGLSMMGFGELAASVYLLVSGYIVTISSKNEGRLERRWRISLLPARSVTAGKGQVGQLGYQQGVQRGDVGRSAMQA
jgi:hypothetical protein